MDLGPNITLQGFGELDAADIIIIKKLVGNYVKRISLVHPDFEKLELHYKPVHASSVEIHGTLICSGNDVHADVTDTNLFYAVDGALKKLDAQLRH